MLTAHRRMSAFSALIAGAAFCAIVATTAVAASLDFFKPNSSPEAAGDSPTSVVIADLDGDSDQDLAVANFGSDNVTILKNNGGGNFSEPASSPEAAGDAPQSVALADLDGDSDQDLAVANRDSDNLTILKNNGGGNFSEPASSPEAAGDAPQSVALADLDGDSDQDLAVANRDSGNVTILKNNGGGNFSEPASSPELARAGPRSVAAVDLDGDADQDLAVANQGDNSVTILKNKGNGNFTEPASSPEATGVTPFSVAAADLDGDSDQDLAVANESDGTVTILRNRGTGNFTEPASSPVPTDLSPFAVVAADFDADDAPDLAVANASGGNVTILGNSGTGKFSEPNSSPEKVGLLPLSVAAADLDGDSDQDLAVANGDSANVTILKNR